MFLIESKFLSASVGSMMISSVMIVDSIEANNFVAAVLKDVILHMNLELNKCRGQCYDGASNMAGSKNGTATQILKDETRAVYTHCYGHALNLHVILCGVIRYYVTHLVQRMKFRSY